MTSVLALGLTLYIAPMLWLAGVGLLLFLAGVDAGRSGWRSRCWPSVDGMVKEVEVVDRHSAYDNTSVSMPRVRYVYRVGSISYSGTNIGFGLGAGNAVVWWGLRGLAPGSGVRVYYDPAQPSKSALRPGIAPSAALLVVAGACCVIGVLCRMVAP